MAAAAPAAAASASRRAAAVGSAIGSGAPRPRPALAPPRATNKDNPRNTAATKAELAGLEAGISAIQAALALQERLTGGGAARRRANSSKHPHPSHHPHHHGATARAPTTKQREWKRVSIRGKAAGEREVAEEVGGEEEQGGGDGSAVDPSSWSLRSYLALPVEQYSVLDPRFIRRLAPDEVERIQNKDEQGSGSSSGSNNGGASSSSSSSCFRLTVPLSDVVGMDIVVEVDVEVEVDRHHEQASSSSSSNPGVTFRADRLCLTGSALAPGGPAAALERAEVELRLEARLSTSSLKRSNSKGRIGTASATTQQQQQRPLRLEADARVSLRVPPPLSAAPAPLLGATGSLVARMAMRALLPPFLDLLAADYARWAGEERRKKWEKGGVEGGGEGGGEAAAQGGRAAALDTEAVGSLMGPGVGEPKEVVVEVVDGGRR